MCEGGGAETDMIRILHGADLHLDSPFQGLSRDQAIARRAEQRALLHRLGALAEETRADLVLLAGDLFDSANTYHETAEQLGEVLSSIPVPVFIAPGNHDPYNPRSAWERLRLGGNVHVFRSEAMESVTLPDLGVRVWGTAFTGRYRTAPLGGFAAPEKRPELLDVMVLHGEVGNPASDYGPIVPGELAASGMDYVALGHVHTKSGLCRAGNTFYAWPGCPEGRGFDETGEKGVYLVELEKDGCRVEFLPLGGRRYEVLEVDITNNADIPAALEAALEGDMSRDIYRICLVGETDGMPDIAALTRMLEGRFFALELRDETRPRRDIWDGREQDSLKGMFLARLYALYATAASDGERENIVQAVRWGLRAMENGDELPL